jgi:ribose transport system permease protein
LINGLVITKLHVNTFVATLGTAAAFTGVAALYSGSKPIGAFVPGFDSLGAGRVLGVAVPLILMAALFVVGGAVLSRTVYGRSLFATGGNHEAARLAGLRVDRIQIVAFVVSGLSAALAGAVLASSLSTGQFDQGSTVALDSIAAVVIGGTSLYGGEGAMWRTLVGVLILATMNNLFSSLSIATPTQMIIKGVVVVAAVAFEELARRSRG